MKRYIMIAILISIIYVLIEFTLATKATYDIMTSPPFGTYISEIVYENKYIYRNDQLALTSGYSLELIEDLDLSEIITTINKYKSRKILFKTNFIQEHRHDQKQLTIYYYQSISSSKTLKKVMYLGESNLIEVLNNNDIYEIIDGNELLLDLLNIIESYNQ